MSPADTAARPALLRVLVARTEDQAGPLVAALHEAGLEPTVVPAIAIEPAPAGGALDQAAMTLDRYDWVVVTSANGARMIAAAASRAGQPMDGPRWAAVGDRSSAVLRDAGVRVHFRPRVASAVALGTTLPVGPDDRILLVQGDLAGERLPVTLRARGATVEVVVGYRTREAPEASRPLLHRALADVPRIRAIVFTSGSTVRGVLALAAPHEHVVRAIPAVCIGPATAREATRLGFERVAVSPGTGPEAVAAAAAAITTGGETP
ncbi:MAG TPA: uroporphyrinogen-III synthase [Candidatus Limnocylindrales bacterium]|nr:uroporphyrinogen-III synthase [Candidatus Limnocylindrales bacterium]